MTFQELGISEPILHAIDDMGFASPMPIQEAVIPSLLSQTGDLVGLAQTGTGKTGAYGIPLIQNIDTSQSYTQALVVCPTRELCLQIAGDLTDFSKYVSGIHILPVYGGTSIERQIHALKRGTQIIIATPGRLIDLWKRGVAKLDHVRSIVLDEADEMLNMGFSEDIAQIFSAIPEEHTTLLFSATMSKEIEKIARTYLHDAKEIVIGSRNEGAEMVNHEYYLVQASDKYAALKRIVDYYPRIYAIIFCRTKLETQDVADKLIRDGYNAEPLHGDLSQSQRDLTMSKFRLHNTQLLVATDVAARGLDVDDLTHVINYGLPEDIENYTHRSGRTGRAGKKGTSISIVHLREQGKIRNIEKTIGKGFVKKTLPTPKEICTKQLFNAIDILEKTDVDEDGIAPFLPEVFHKLDWLDKEDIIKRFVALEFGRFLRYYANAPQIEEPQGRGKSKGKGKDKDTKTRRGKSGSRNGIAEEGYARYFIPLGKKDNIYPKELLGLINKHSKKPIDVGRIDLMKGFAFFEVPEEQASRLEKSMEGASYKGRAVKIERANAKDAGVSMKQGEGKKKRKDKDRPAKKWYDEVSKSHHKPSRKK
ncbi:MAG TPA: ATP-dependent RNA helicase [Prevotellaceae bacterium]|jgi:ATP-dependent RNA helicase DeaD|nr:ATP-dependent RNA helicase [Prevotellaceae bacterium]